MGREAARQKASPAQIGCGGHEHFNSEGAVTMGDVVHDCYLIVLDFQFYHIYRDRNDIFLYDV